MSGLEAGDEWTALLAGFLVAGGGIGLVNPPLATTAVGSSTPRGPAWRPASTPRSARSGSRPASRGSARSSSTSWPAPSWRGPASRPAAGAADEIADFISFGGAQRAGNAALARAGEQAFVTGLNDILHYAAVVAFAGALLARC